MFTENCSCSVLRKKQHSWQNNLPLGPDLNPRKARECLPCFLVQAIFILSISWTSYTLKTQEEIPKSALAGAAFPKYSLSCPTFTDYLCVGMYERKTFTFLAAIVQRSRQVASLAVLRHREEPEGIFS
uniref:Uncharacterized protein n=1 Tax=Bubo bubo TaxID=30461 RepID=A0A8C0F167_BUBBB